MTESDLSQVVGVGDRVHPDYPESAGIFAERLRLYPPGCLVIDGGQGILGYAIGHPWLFGRPPKLNTWLEQLPAQADTFHVHDVALTDDARGAGSGMRVVDRFVCQARTAGLRSMSLVAVTGSVPFWQRNGFEVLEQDAIRAGLLTYGASSCFMARPLA